MSHAAGGPRGARGVAATFPADTIAMSHVPVMVDEVLRALQPRAGGIYVDCTFGEGGHTQAILDRVGPNGRVLAMDRDPHAAAVGNALASRDPRLSMFKGTYTALAAVAGACGLTGKVDGILFDLGISSAQLDDAARGFGFQSDGPLDMRMDPEHGISAAAWLRRAREEDIASVLRRFGEERRARAIARAIVRARRHGAIERTGQLARIVSAVARPSPRGKHPATRTFQALRIYINGELDALGTALGQTIPVLAAGGRLAVISFHSLEDRLVKRFIRAHSRPDPGAAALPVPAHAAPPPLRAIGKFVRPSAGEVERNPRARSAVLRVAEKRA